MAIYLKKFDNHTQYETYTASTEFITPNVSYCVNENEVHYNPYVPPFFCKLTLNDGSVNELKGSGELTSAMTSAYSATVVSAEIGELCTTIGGGAFYSYTGLTSVIIPDSVTTIGGRAFERCRGLTSVTIGNSVEIISGQAFMNCNSLSAITSYIMKAPDVSPGTFAEVSNGGTLYVPKNSSGYDTWMSNQGNLGQYNWTKVEQ